LLYESPSSCGPDRTGPDRAGPGRGTGAGRGGGASGVWLRAARPSTLHIISGQGTRGGHAAAVAAGGAGWVGVPCDLATPDTITIQAFSAPAASTAARPRLRHQWSGHPAWSGTASGPRASAPAAGGWGGQCLQARCRGVSRGAVGGFVWGVAMSACGALGMPGRRPPGMARRAAEPRRRPLGRPTAEL
jgi:hypothetical protein